MTAETGPFASSFDVSDRQLGNGSPTYVITEISANHDRDKDQTKRPIDVAVDTGTDAVNSRLSATTNYSVRVYVYV